MAGQYGAPWQALLDSNATPVDPFPNADFDKAMGYDSQPTDSAGVQFAKGLMSSMQRNTPEGRQMTMELAKQKMANQLALQLEEQKAQLKQKYPEYHIEKTPYGAIAINPYKPTDQVTAEAYPGAKDDYSALTKAKSAAEKAKAETESDPAYQKAQLAEQVGKPDLQAAETQYYKDRGPLEQARADAARAQAELAGRRADQADRGKQPDRKEITAEVNEEMQIDPKKPFMNDPAKLALAASEIEKRYQQRMRQWRAGGAGLANPNSVGGSNAAPIPDVSKLMNLNDDGAFGQ